jgi:hypothetical protein
MVQRGLPTHLQLRGKAGVVQSGTWTDTKRGTVMIRMLLATTISIAFAGAAIAADLPRRQPPPPVAPVGKAPIGKYPVGKYPVGKYPVGKAPAPVITKG